MSRQVREFGHGEIRMTNANKTVGSELPEIRGSFERDKELLGFGSDDGGGDG